MLTTPRPCLYCNKIFRPLPQATKIGQGKYCTKQCYVNATSKSEIRDCIVCDKSFKTDWWAIKNGYGKHCSMRCAGITHAGVMKGRPSNRKGIKISDDTRAKIAPTMFVKGQIPHNKGKTGWLSDEAIEKLRTARLKQKLPMKDTSIEIKIDDILSTLAIKYEHPYSFKCKGFACQFDFAVPELQLAIECDGDYWHSLETSKVRDDKKAKYCNKNNWVLLRLSETQINNDLSYCKNEITTTLKTLQHNIDVIPIFKKV